MTVAIRQLAGLSLAEAALYAAEHAPRGAAVDVPLTAGERLDIRLGLPTGKRPSGDLKLYSTDDGEDGITAAPAAGRYLAVKLRHVGHGAADAAPLTLNLPTEVAIVIIPAGRAVLLSERPDDRTLIVEAAGDEPTRPAKPKASATLNTLSYLASNSWRP